MITLDKALIIAVEAHSGQLDKQDRPYILHPLAVMASVQPQDEIHMTVAVLHDVIEDTSWTEAQLRAELNDDKIVDAVVAITKRRGEKYEEYLERVKANPIALAVKKADIQHNCSRLDGLEQHEKQYLESKYAQARKILGMDDNAQATS